MREAVRFKIKPKRVTRKRPPGYQSFAKAAYVEALKGLYGSQGAASSVRRIDPTTGKVLVSETDGLRERIGVEHAQKL